MASSNLDPQTGIAGVILCGGRGTRSGGADKPLLEWQGQPLIEHVLQRLVPQVSDIIISANRNQARYLALAERALQTHADTKRASSDGTSAAALASATVRVVADRLPDYAGPLAGVQAALQSVGNRWCFVCPGDAPNLPKNLVRELWQHQEADKPLVAHDGMRQQQLHFLLPPAQFPTLTAYLHSGRRSARGFHEICGSLAVPYPDPSGFQNLNRLAATRRC